MMKPGNFLLDKVDSHITKVRTNFSDRLPRILPYEYYMASPPNPFDSVFRIELSITLDIARGYMEI